MKLQLATVASARQLATMTARFHVLAATELDHTQIAQLTQRLKNNLNQNIEIIANAAHARIRDRRYLSATATETFNTELSRLQHSMAPGGKSLH